MQKLYRISLILIWLTTCIHAAKEYTIATSPIGTSYYELAKSMKPILDSENIVLKVLPTNGSIENIELVLNKKVDFAIVQNDTTFFVKNGIGNLNDDENILRLVLPLFKEPIFILTNKIGIYNIQQLKNKKVSIGGKTSGLSESANIIFNSLGIWETLSIQNLEEKQAVQQLLNQQIDAAFINNISKNIEKLLKEKKLFLIPISNRIIQTLQKTFPIFTSYQYRINTLEKINTVGITSILITRNDIDDTTVEHFVDSLLLNYNLLKFPDKKFIIKNKIFNYKNEIDWAEGTLNYTEKNNIKLDSSYNYNIIYIFYLIIIIIIILSIAFFILIILLHKYKIFVKMKFSTTSVNLIANINKYIVKNKYILLAVFLVIGFMLSILLIQYFEHLWAIENNVISIFDGFNILDSIMWLFMFGATGYNGDYFPNSFVAKFIVSIVPIIGVGGFFTLVGFMTSDQIQKYILEGKGMYKVNFSNHILICGWNQNISELINSLQHQNLQKKKEIVILTDVLDYNPVEKFGYDSHYVKFIYGKATDRESLDKANLAEADIAIFLADESPDPDARTILDAMVVEKYCKELEDSGIRKEKRNIYTIAEIKDQKNKQIAFDANIDDIISLGNIETKLFIQAIQTPGINKFIDEIFTYNDFNDIYTIDIQKGCMLVGKTYDEILILLRKHQILLLSINLEYRVNKLYQNDFFKKYHLTRKVITNPINIYEQNYKTEVGDILIVLAKYEKDVYAARKLLKREGT